MILPVVFFVGLEHRQTPARGSPARSCCNHIFILHCLVALLCIAVVAFACILTTYVNKTPTYAMADAEAADTGMEPPGLPTDSSSPP